MKISLIQAYRRPSINNQIAYLLDPSELESSPLGRLGQITGSQVGWRNPHRRTFSPPAQLSPLMISLRRAGSGSREFAPQKSW